MNVKIEAFGKHLSKLLSSSKQQFFLQKEEEENKNHEIIFLKNIF